MKLGDLDPAGGGRVEVWMRRGRRRMQSNEFEMLLTWQLLDEDFDRSDEGSDREKEIRDGADADS